MAACHPQKFRADTQIQEGVLQSKISAKASHKAVLAQSVIKKTKKPGGHATIATSSASNSIRVGNIRTGERCPQLGHFGAAPSAAFNSVLP